MIEVVKPTYCWPETTLQMFPLLVEHLERCGRVCYKSEDRITAGSADKFVRGICRNRHESVLEHAVVTAIVICSRACSHQLVRHRIAAYSQESQRYVNYGKEDHLRVVCPSGIGLSAGVYFFENTSLNKGWFKYREGPVLPDKITDPNQIMWLYTIRCCYDEYKRELTERIKPEDARYVLPNATKTELAVTFNLRQWRHVFRERALNSHAQWEIREIFSAILCDLKGHFPAVFDDLS